MSAPRPANTDRRAIAALFAVFALLAQALMPAAAMAAGPGGAASVICTATGVHAPSADGKTQAPHKGFAGMPCQDCLAVSIAAVVAAPATVEPVAYAIAQVEHAPTRTLFAPRARAPPRPPGQGPPTA